MLEFSEDFFKREERCGFVVEEMMKTVWAAELKVLDDIVFVCKKHGIKYYAAYGTLLGAVRHQGYVPWDDDIDISVDRRDYKRLLECLSRELPSDYHVASAFTDVSHRQPMACVMNSQELPLPREVKKEYFGCPYIIGVDIYSIDYVPRDEQMASLQLAMYNMVYDMAQRYEEICRQGQAEYYLSQIENICGVSIDRNANIVHQLWMLAENISGMFMPEECDMVTWFPRVVQGDKNFYMRKEVYEDCIMMKFENTEVSVPSGYKEILTHMYGDYTSMVRGTSSHGYPFYAKQQEFLDKLAKNL